MNTILNKMLLLLMTVSIATASNMYAMQDNDQGFDIVGPDEAEGFVDPEVDTSQTVYAFRASDFPVAGQYLAAEVPGVVNVCGDVRTTLRRSDDGEFFVRCQGTAKADMVVVGSYETKRHIDIRQGQVVALGNGIMQAGGYALGCCTGLAGRLMCTVRVPAGQVSPTVGLPTEPSVIGEFHNVTLEDLEAVNKGNSK